MIRSIRRQAMAALFMLLWQGPGLASGVLAAYEAPSTRFGENKRIAQVSMPASPGIPVEVLGWFDVMKEQADKGNGAEALKMYERVMTWVQSNLPKKDVFRARVMVRYGYLLDKLGKYQEALTPTQDGSQMLRELSKGNQDSEIKLFLSVALFNLGLRHARLEEQKLAIASFQEALPLLRDQINRGVDLRRELTLSLLLIGDMHKQNDRNDPPSARKDDASSSRPLSPPGGLMEQSDASLQRGLQG